MYLNPSLPATAAAIIINNSGIPKASNPVSVVFHPMDKLDDVTIGISKGDRNPATKIIPAVTNLPFGGRFSILLRLLSIIYLINNKKLKKGP
jgi:hypothetical protein